MFSKLSIAALLLSASAACAAPVSANVTLTFDAGAQVHSAGFTCSSGATEEQIELTYIQSNDTLLALVPVEGEPRVFMNVIAASGEKYVNGSLIWWDKGGIARLSDSLNDGAAMECVREE